MALIGNLIKHDIVASENETEIISITFPEDLPFEHPDYKFRAQTVQNEVAKNVEIQTQYNDCYVIVHSINSWKFKDNNGNKTLMNINYRVYDSKTSRDISTENFLFENHLIGQIIDYNLSKNEIEQAYALALNIKGFEFLKKD